MNKLHKVYIGLGSNLNDPVLQVTRAITALDKLPNTELCVSSSLHQTSPMGPQDQPDFINAVALILTRLTPLELLRSLQQLEQHYGRIRKEKWGPRTLDLDILLYGDEWIKTDVLTIPHPGLKERDFVLKPLYEIAPELILPCKISIKHLLESLEVTEVV